jgi:hypothetical protein
VSTPPVMARRSSTMVMPSLFLWLKGVARTRWPSDP